MSSSTAIAKMRPDDLFRAIRVSPEIVKDMRGTRDAGLANFRYAEQQADIHWARVQDEYTQVILWLHIIREYNLWEFAEYKNWSHFIHTWCENGGRSESTIHESLKALRMWSGPSLKRLPEEIVEFADGIGSIEPLFRPEDRGGVIKSYNPRTGEITALIDEIEAKYTGTTSGEKLNAMIDTIPRENTRMATRDAISSETDTKPEIKLIPLYESGKIVGTVWQVYDKDGQLVADGSYNQDDLWDAARLSGGEKLLIKQLGFPREWMV